MRLFDLADNIRDLQLDMFLEEVPKKYREEIKSIAVRFYRNGYTDCQTDIKNALGIEPHES